MDLSRRESLYAFIEAVRADHPVIDILVCNAGIIKRAPAAEYSDAAWDEVMEVNLNAQFILINATRRPCKLIPSVPRRSSRASRRAGEENRTI